MRRSSGRRSENIVVFSFTRIHPFLFDCISDMHKMQYKINITGLSA
nr:MAG TPA: hypothetical protein [Caudoviricetes sp.]